MPCYRPLPAIYTPEIRPDGKRPVKVYREGTELHSYVNAVGELIEPFSVPCGRCIGCRLDYSRRWADRLTMEALDYSPSMCWFVTLTYDDDHLPSVGPVGISSLVPRDVELFMKRLRERWLRLHQVDNIRFFLSGEYGSTTFRPHYHLLLYGVPFFDLKLHSTNIDGDPLYSSSELDEVWGNGFTLVGALTWHSAAYTARYVVKKLKGKDAKQIYADAGLVPEFVRMSRKPGIGARFMNENFDKIYEHDSVSLPDGLSCKPPKYMDRLLRESDPLAYDRIRKHRVEMMELNQRELSHLTDLTPAAYLRLQEQIKSERVRSLVRKEV